MADSSSRRRFLQTSALGGGLVGLGQLEFLGGLRPVAAADLKLDSAVKFDADIEPLVKLLEETPREKLLEAVGEKIRRGTTYREVLAALFLAGIRNVQSRPNVGFKFHAVLVVNSAHLASLNGPDSERWLPIFWALDYFKSAQAKDVEEGDWTMSAPNESALPPAEKARDAFVAAMENWDEGAADAAVTRLARTAGLNEIFELFYNLGARDFRSIGHKAIYVANSERLLRVIGERHAEPVLRSLAYALQNREGGDNPAKSDLEADRPGRRNCELAAKIRPEWLAGTASAEATAELLAAYRRANANDACDLTIETMNRGIGPQAVWDAIFQGAGELLMRQPGIVALHAVTSSNALRYAFDTAANDSTRRMMLLQNVAFLTLFRDRVNGRGAKDTKIDEVKPTAPERKDAGAVEEIFAAISDNRDQAAAKVLGYLDAGGDPTAFIDAARRMVFLKGRDSHDYKFSSAVLEDFYHVSPTVRNRFLASAVFNLPGSGAKDNGLIARARAALKT